MPFLLIIILPAIFSIGIFFLDIYLIRQWLLFKDTIYTHYANNCLIWAIVLTIISIFGRLLITFIFSKVKAGTVNPTEEDSNLLENLNRPDGSKIHIKIYGDKQNPPIIFIHGWNANSNEWFYERRYFTDKYRVIVYDLPGLGKSKGPENKDYSLIKMANDLNAILEHLHLSNVVLWGHSMGGMIILTYCTRILKNNYKNIKGIILQHTTFTDPTKTSILNSILPKIEKPVLFPICYIMIALWPLIWLLKWLSYFNGTQLISTRFLFFTGTQTPAQLNFISLLSAKSSPAVFARGMLAMMKTYDVTNELQHLNIPTLILSGKYDRLTKPFASAYMNKSITNSIYYSLPNSGHQGLVENNQDTIKIANSFLNHLKIIKDDKTNEPLISNLKL